MKKIDNYYLFTILTILLLITINAVTIIYDNEQNIYKNALGFLDRLTYINIGIVLMMSFPVFIMIMVIYSPYKKMKTKYIEYMLMREDYYIVMIKEWTKIYLKCLFFPILFLVIYFIGRILYPNYNYSNNEVLHISFRIINIYLLSLIIANIGLILTRCIDKFYLLLPASFLLFFFISLIEGVVFLSSFPRLGVLIDLYNFSLLDPNYIGAIVLGIIRLIITEVLVVLLYRKKEEIIL